MAGVARAVRSPAAHEMDGHHARGEGGDGGGQERKLEPEVIHEGHLRHRRRGCREDRGRGQVRLAAQDARYEVLGRAHEKTCGG